MGMVKKVVQQGRSHFDAQSVLALRERSRPEEGQVCEPEGLAQQEERCWRIFSTFPNYPVRGQNRTNKGRDTARMRISNGKPIRQ